MGLGNESCRGLFRRAVGDVKFHLRRRRIERFPCAAAGDLNGGATVRPILVPTPARSERRSFWIRVACPEQRASRDPETR
jgi:hypothetical protein